MSTTPEQKIVQYLNEAHASEVALTRVLQSQIAMTPRGSPIQAATGVAQTVVGQALALGKTPLDLLRGSGGEEKVLKNAKDAAATEALEIATYTSLERLARSVGDDVTADLAASVRTDEEQMLRRILSEIPKLTGLVVGAEIEGDPSYDLAKTGAADAARVAGVAAKQTAKKTATKAKRQTRQARKVPGVARAEGRAKGAVASQSDLPISNYDKLKADEVTAKLPELSQVDLAKVDTYERKNDDRTTVTEKVSTLQAKEPWPGYDEQTVEEIVKALGAASDAKAKDVRTYERAHKDRAGVITAAERELATA